MTTIVERMSKNAMLSTIDSMFIEYRGTLFDDKFDQLLKAEKILNKIGFHMMILDTDKINLAENRSGRIILKIYDTENMFIGSHLIYFWTYNTQMKKYQIFGQLG